MVGCFFAVCSIVIPTPPVGVCAFILYIVASRVTVVQPAHILADLHTEHVLAFLDFADAQPGDPPLDIAVATLWDQELADLLLEGYCGIENNAETQQILSLYRLLRHLGEIP